jgi:type I restriction enzyme S subunit
MDVKNGYKKTEVGVIPEDWQDLRFEDVLTGFASGATPFRGRPDYYKGYIRWITSGELNYNTITDTVEKVTEEAVRNTNLKILPVGTFLMAITGLEAAGTRGSCGIVGKESTTNQSCMALLPIEGKIIIPYLYHFYVRYGNELAFRYCQGTKQQSYTGRLVKILPINLPPTLTEQRAIATALSDVDDLITALDRIIAKKKAVKQGAMQELLTGRKRLDGFSGQWESERLSKYAKLINGRAYSLFEWKSEGTPVIRLQNLTGRGEDYYYSTLQLPEKQYCNFGDLLFMWSATFGPVFWKGGKAIFHYHIWRVECDMSNLNKHFLFYILSELTEKIKRESSSGGTMLHVTKGMMESIKIPIPTLAEQTAIAQILSDMDTEISTLETQREKYKSVKQGMMQELLTGKMRLV